MICSIADAVHPVFVQAAVPVLMVFLYGFTVDYDNYAVLLVYTRYIILI